MPLVTCPDCSAEVSDAAPACPKCGRPIRTGHVEVHNTVTTRPETSPVTWGCLIMIIMVVLIGATQGLVKACN